MASRPRRSARTIDLVYRFDLTRPARRPGPRSAVEALGRLERGNRSNIQLSYGRTGLTVALPDVVEVLYTRFTPGLPDDIQAVRDAWEKILLHQFHDILPGSSIARVYEEADQVYQDVLTDMEHAIQQSLASYCTPGKSITVFNSLNWSRKALVLMPEGVNGGVDQQGKRTIGTEDRRQHLP